MTSIKMTEEKIPLPEAPASINFKVVDKDGFNYQITLRDFSENALMGRVKAIRSWLLENSFVPPGKQSTGNGSPPPASVPPPSTQPDGDLLFEAELLVGSTSGDKTYWKVQGGQFSKYGVTIWPEVLDAAGFDASQLDATSTYNLNGYTAYYSLKDTGKPDKVVNLSK